MSTTKSVKTISKEVTQENERTLRPLVDIYEGAEKITLKADLPGVGKDGLSIELDGDTLTIEGQANIDIPEGMESLYAEIRATCYVRSFSLSGELESENINAAMENGELTLIIPKRAAVQMRKIEVTGG